MTVIRILGLILPLALLSVTASSSESPFETAGPVAARAMAQYLDQFQTALQTQLELVASTPGAARNDWSEVKPYLARMAQNSEGLWWMMLADGDYYSLDRDFTQLNLSNRPYFQDLRSGKFVSGWPGYSRATGMRSAIFAAPIMVDGQFQGAIGASIFLDPLHARISADMALPPAYSWFVIDGQGNNMLDPDSGWIFMNTLTDSTASLREAMEQALAAESGHVSYEIGGIGRQGAFQKLDRLDWRMVVIEREATELVIRPDVNESLLEVTARLQQRLQSIDTDTAAVIAGWKGRTPSSEEIREGLAQLIEGQPLLVNASFVDANGMITMIEPSDWRNFENSDISQQAHVARVREGLEPVLSDTFEAVEGGLAVVVSHPILDDQGSFMGAASLLIYPNVLVERVLSQLDIPEHAEVWVMSASDGLMLYDPDADEVGRRLLSDPMYASFTGLRELGMRVMAEERGSGDYAFDAMGHQGVVHKAVEWDTVILHGTPWRVAIAYSLGQ